MDERSAVVAQTMDDIRTIEAESGAGRETVEQIRDRLLALASRHDLFSLDVFPPPSESEKSRGWLYRIAQDPDDRYALYVNSSRGNVSTPAHNHTTWAVVVGREGQELNKFYEHSADGGVKQIDEYMVEDGTGVAMVGDDLHSIHIDGPALNFHCYGLALERLDERQYYDPKGAEWKVFPAGAHIVEGRPGFSS